MAKKILRKLSIYILIISVVFSQAGLVFAADDDIESLESYLDQVKIQISENNNSLDEIYQKIDEINIQIEENNILLEEQQASFEEQQEAMGKRIQYMYESGTAMDIINAFFTSGTIAEALKKAAYIVQIVAYDRNKLKHYADTVSKIEALQVELEAEKDAFKEQLESFESAKQNSLQIMADVSARLEELRIEEEEAMRVMEELMKEEAQAPEAPEMNIPDPTKPAESSKETTEETTEAKTEDPDDAEEPTDPEEPDEDDPAEEPDDSYENTDDGYDIPIPTYGYSREAIYNLARVTYLEDGCVYPRGSYQSIYLCACVILNRANSWYGGSINSAIYAPGQYATAYKYTNWGGGKLTINSITWQAVEDALTNCDPNPYYQCNGQWLASMGLTEYYRDPVSDEVFYYGR